MNEQLQNQVAEMKKQTIGVEVEMNSITRQNAAKTAAEFFGTGRFRTRPVATVTTPGRPGMPRAASGSSSGTAASTVRMTSGAKW